MRVQWLPIVFAAYLAWLPSAVQAETVLENIRNNGVLKVGIREDAVPFGFLDANENLSGLCLDFVNILLQEVKQTLQRDAIIVKIFKSTLFNRFDLVSDRVINLECGPNTIRDAVDYQIAFSQPFFITGTQFLIRAEDENQFKPGASLENTVVGVLRNTTNKTVIENRFPLAQLREFQGPTGRLRGVQALQQGKINAFASDGILLVGEAALQGLVLGQTYRIVPQNPIDCESYGMILPNNDPQWQELVNQSILKAREVRLFREWLGVVLPEIQEVLSYCDQQKTIPSQ
jgi:polar amino acid transport system substrate-binding protein